ncbi:MAG: DUF4198 domain-containing protein [Planctomycetes bacterium]|nr:DUF4198 domain-containing protein [Planctomycetota bacterium]
MKPAFWRVASAVLVAAGLTCVLPGCAGGPATVEVSGTVTFDGKPIPDGQITFHPAQGTGRSYSGKIENGKFSFQCEPGAKKVEITATREVKADASKLSPEEQVQLEEEGAEGTVPEQYIPARYNTQTELTAEVKESGDNTFEFNLKSEQ